MKEHFLDNPDFAPFVVDFNQCVYLRAQPAQYSAPQLCAFGARRACQWHFPASWVATRAYQKHGFESAAGPQA